MEKVDISKRIEDVMRTDATVASEADFMLTHMPFKRLAYYRQDYQIGTAHTLIRENDYIDVPRFDEQTVFDDLVANEDQHKLFMIIGRNGSGKSHLIRWLYYQLKKSIEDSGEDTEKTIFIPRAHNNLKDALKSILEAGVLSGERVQYYMNKIGGGSSNAGEEELKDLIYANLSIIVKHDEKDSELSEIERRKLYDFLGDEAVENYYFRSEHGPINHIYNALTKNSSDITNGDPFQSAMFVMEPRQIMSTLRTANHVAKNDVIKFAQQLSNDVKLREKIIKYLNSRVSTVLERTSSISGADVHSIFEEMRKELKEEGKRLTLFIEDINVYKGIDSALIEVLIQEHTDTNGLCRIKSVVGSTDRYFDDYFNDALKDRMTRKIVILEKTLLEDKSKLLEFAARYINAIHFSKEMVKEWYENDLEFPVWEDSHTFSLVEIDGVNFSIFPFNENAIINLFECLDDRARSPRGFLKCVVKAVSLLWNEYEEHMIDAKHYLLSNDGISRINGFLEQKDQMAFDAKKYADSDRRALLYQIWGNRTFREDEKGVLAGITDEVLDVFKMDKDGSVRISDKSESNTQPVKVPVVQPIVQPQIDTSFQKRIKDITDWQEGIKEEFVPHKDARKILSDFILKNINWELENIPYSFAKEFIGKIQNYEIEGQSVVSNGAIKIERSKLSGQLLVALFNQDNQKASKNAWNYDGGPEEEVIAKTWLLKNKANILDIVRNELFRNEDIEQVAVEAQMVSLMSLGLLDSWDSLRIFELLLRTNIAEDERAVHKSDDRWKTLSAYFETKTPVTKASIIQAVFDSFYINTVGITKADSGNVKYVIVDAVELLKRIEAAKLSLADKKTAKDIKSADERICVASQAIHYYKNEVSDSMNDIVTYARRVLRSYEEWLGKSSTEVQVRKTIERMTEYLHFIKYDAGYNYPPKMISALEGNSTNREIIKLIKMLNNVCDNAGVFERQILCGSLPTQRIAEIYLAFSDFETFMKEKTAMFSSRIDTSLDKRISQVEKEISDAIDDCLAKGKE